MSTAVYLKVQRRMVRDSIERQTHNFFTELEFKKKDSRPSIACVTSQMVPPNFNYTTNFNLSLLTWIPTNQHPVICEGVSRCFRNFRGQYTTISHYRKYSQESTIVFNKSNYQLLPISNLTILRAIFKKVKAVRKLIAENNM